MTGAKVHVYRGYVIERVAEAGPNGDPPALWRVAATGGGAQTLAEARASVKAHIRMRSGASSAAERTALSRDAFREAGGVVTSIRLSPEAEAAVQRIMAAGHATTRRGAIEWALMNVEKAG